MPKKKRTKGKPKPPPEDDDDWGWGDVKSWSVDDVCKYIVAAGMDQYTSCFRGNNITGRRLLRVQGSNLLEMGIQKWEDHKIIISVIKEAQDRANGIVRSPIRSHVHDEGGHEVIADYEDKAFVPSENHDFENHDDASSEEGNSPRFSKALDNFDSFPEQPNDLIDSAQSRAATIIQRRARGMAGRMRFQKVKSGEIEPAAKAPKKKKSNNPPSSQLEACVMIQRTTRGMIGRKLYRKIRESRGKSTPNESSEQGSVKMDLTVEEISERQKRAAIKIQTAVRGKAGRRRFQIVKNGETKKAL